MNQEHFIPDAAETAAQQNSILSQHMDGVWRDHLVVSIQRIVIGSVQGWLLIYRN